MYVAILLIPRGMPLVDGIRKHLEDLSARNVRRCRYANSLIVSFVMDAIPTYLIKPKSRGMLLLFTGEDSTSTYQSEMDGKTIVWQSLMQDSSSYHQGVVRNVLAGEKLVGYDFSDKLSSFTQAVFDEDTSSLVTFCKWFIKGNMEFLERRC